MQYDRMMTTKEVAAFMRVSTAHVLREVAAGRLRPMRLGKRTLRYSAEELRRYTSCEAGYGLA